MMTNFGGQPIYIYIYAHACVCVLIALMEIPWETFKIIKTKKDVPGFNSIFFFDECNTQKRVEGTPPWQQENHVKSTS